MRFTGYFDRFKAIVDEAKTEFELERMREDLQEMRVIVENRLFEFKKKEFSRNLNGGK